MSATTRTAVNSWRLAFASVLAICVITGGCGGAAHDDSRSAFTVSTLRDLGAGVKGMLTAGHEPSSNETLAEVVHDPGRSGYFENRKDLRDAWNRETAWSVLKTDGRGNVISLVSAGNDGAFGSGDDLTVYVVSDSDGAIRVTPCCVGYGKPYGR